MDIKILRAGTTSAVSLLVVGLFIGNYGGLGPILSLAPSLLGAAIITILISVFLTYIYLNWFANFLPGSILAKGAIFGALVWLVFLILGGLFSFFKESVFPQLDPGNALFLSLLLFSTWGAVAALSLESKN